MGLLMVSQPGGMWEKILFGIESGVGNYAIAIILITLIIKIVLLPADFMNKYVTKKNSKKQMELKPEIDKIKQRYGSNPDIVNKKTMELYKAKGYSVGGMCGIMLLYMGATMAIFFTLLGALNSVSYYKMYTEYDAVKVAYEAEYDVKYQPEYDTVYQATIDAGTIGEGYDTLEAYAIDTAKAAADTKATADAQAVAIATYGEVKTGFLWIKNIWRPDTYQSPIMDYNTFKNNVNKLVSEDEMPTEEEYNKIMLPVAESAEYSGWNGYFILCILAAVTTFGSVYINNLVLKIKAKKKGVVAVNPAEMGGKAMNFVMPIIMGLFTLLYTASFGIYIVTGSIFTMLTGVGTTILVDKLLDKKEQQVKSKRINSYDRNNK